MIDPQMQRYFQRIYGAQASPEILRSRPERKPRKRRSLFVNRLTQDSTKSPSVIFQESFRRTSMGGSTERLSSLPESHRSSALSRKIDDFLNSVVENNNNNHSERRKKEDIRGSTRSLSSGTLRSSNSSRRRTMDYPLPDLSKVKSTLLTSKHYQGPRGRNSGRSSSSDRITLRISTVPHSTTDNESSQDSAYAGESSRQHTPVARHPRSRRRPSLGGGGPPRDGPHPDTSSFQLSTYLKYLNEVTTDILAQGAYSPKSLNKILESRLVKYQKETSRREALEMMAKLKMDLGISSGSSKKAGSQHTSTARARHTSTAIAQQTSSARAHHPSSAGHRKRNPPETNLYRSRSCDDVLDLYSDRELLSLLKKDAGLEEKLADDVIRMVRGTSENNLSRTRGRKKPQQPPAKEEENYNDEEFEKSSESSDAEEVDSSSSEQEE